MIIVDRNTTSDTGISFERYCLGYVQNHHNRYTKCLKLNWVVCKVQKWKLSKIPYSLYVLAIPLNNSLIWSSGCAGFYQIFTWPRQCYRQKLHKLDGCAIKSDTGGVIILYFQCADLSKIHLVSKCHTNEPNIKLITPFCAIWHYRGIKG